MESVGKKNQPLTGFGITEPPAAQLIRLGHGALVVPQSGCAPGPGTTAKLRRRRNCMFFLVRARKNTEARTKT